MKKRQTEDKNNLTFWSYIYLFSLFSSDYILVHAKSRRIIIIYFNILKECKKYQPNKENDPFHILEKKKLPIWSHSAQLNFKNNQYYLFKSKKHLGRMSQPSGDIGEIKIRVFWFPFQFIFFLELYRQDQPPFRKTRDQIFFYLKCLDNRYQVVTPHFSSLLIYNISKPPSYKY